jgi:hypothetical protein
MPAWFKPFAEKIQQQEADKQQQSISQRVTAHDKLKEIPKSFYKGRALPAEGR